MVNGDYLWFCQFQFLVCNTSLAVEGTLVHRLQWLQHLTACFIQNGQGGLKISQTLYYWTPWTTFTKWVFDSIIPSIGCPKKNETGVFLNILNQVSDFNLFFFSWKLRSIRKFWIQNHFCAIFGGWDILNKMRILIRLFRSKLTLSNLELQPILKTIKIKTVITYIQSVWITRPTNNHYHGPSWASWLSLAQNLSFWGHYETVWIWIDLFQNCILFCKYLGPLISVLYSKFAYENLILGCWDI